MIPGTIRGCNFTYTAPPGVPNCQDLRVRRDESQGVMTISSAWFPTREELEAMLAGEPVVFTVWGSIHPVIYLGVQKPEAEDAHPV